MYCQSIAEVPGSPVQVCVGRTLNVQRAAADVINCLIVQHHSHIGVLQEGVSGQDRVVGLHDRGGDLPSQENVS
jgi:hypothetical protein